jgi:pimeloyl-ACP methyl ester carboxylesterase
VGHSASGITATFYANRYPVSGVVNVDASLQVAPFSGLLHSIAGSLDEDTFPAVWEMFMKSMHIELLPEAAQRLLARTNTPDRELVVGYWADVLSRSVEELVTLVECELAALRASGLPYTVVTGDRPASQYRSWLAASLPQAQVVSWDGSGHFPHLAHPQRFARLLAATGAWQHRTAG